MLPNACFPLYPVVDYRTFARTRFDREAVEIYEEGVRWMLRGVLHLLAYRLVRNDLLLDNQWAMGMGDAMLQLIATFLLYLQVSGRFHLIVGVLHLFGFRLPETHHLYLLSSGFTDAWRRINIYWKDFMMQVAWYPLYFRWRGAGTRAAVVTATLAVFACTWALHSYQFFWLNGTPLLEWRDAAFWGAFGVLAAFAAVRELRADHRTVPSRVAWRLTRGLSVVGTMSVILVLWSFWTARSWPEWIAFVGEFRYTTPLRWLALAALVAGGVVVGGFPWGAPRLPLDAERAKPLQRGAVQLLTMGALSAMTIPSVRESLPAELPWLVEHARGYGSPWRPGQNVARGYYDRLAPRAATDTVGAWRVVPPRPDLGPAKLWVTRNDFLHGELTPSVHATFVGKPFSTNRWGLRDRDRTLEKPPRTFRIAVIGASATMGWGVADDETFTHLAERSLDSVANTRGLHVEVLNVSLAGWSLAQRAFAVGARASQFAPDLVLIAVHSHEMDLHVLRFQEDLTLGFPEPIPDAKVTELLATSGITRGMGGREATRRMVPLEGAIERRSMLWAREQVDSGAATLELLALRYPGVPQDGSAARTLAEGRALGLGVVDCSSLWNTWNFARFAGTPADPHPNARGHRLIAECLAARLLAPTEPLAQWMERFSHDAPARERE